MLRKERAAGTRVILLTGFGDEMMGRGERPSEIDLVLGKPVSAADLREAVFRVMSGGIEGVSTEGSRAGNLV